MWLSVHDALEEGLDFCFALRTFCDLRLTASGRHLVPLRVDLLALKVSLAFTIRLSGTCAITVHISSGVIFPSLFRSNSANTNFSLSSSPGTKNSMLCSTKSFCSILPFPVGSYNEYTFSARMGGSEMYYGQG